MIYVHVPFCQSRCAYCDFYSTTGKEELKAQFVEAACREIAARAEELPNAGDVRSIYFGGGTPSLLGLELIERLIACLKKHFEVRPNAEITLEANPNDVTKTYAKGLRDLGVNRVSLGVQSFDERCLQLIRRRHTSAEAKQAVEFLSEVGFENLSIDLIYGLPGQNLGSWLRDIKEAFALPIKHLSAYALSIEDSTPLGRWLTEGKVKQTDEEFFLKEYEVLLDEAARAGFEHYEISNFCRPGFHSRHNSAYWDGTPYLGIGPGAHSFNGKIRRANLPNIEAYMLKPDKPPHELEELREEEKFNERIFLSLRTKNGLDLHQMRKNFPEKWIADMELAAKPHVKAGRLERENQGNLRLTRKGLFVSDDVMSDLMRVEGI